MHCHSTEEVRRRNMSGNLTDLLAQLMCGCEAAAATCKAAAVKRIECTQPAVVH